MTGIQQRIKVFFLEDNQDDVELELHELRKGAFEVIYEVARNRKEFFEKLPNLDADIILADYTLPDITGIEAIHICREKKIDVPIIFITGMGNELIAVDSLRAGAIDYILKKHIVGLSARVVRAIEIWAEHKAKEAAEAEKLKYQQLLFQAQKMETVGQLAGGVAHDFNNILTAIIGYGHLLKEKMEEDDNLRIYPERILASAERAANLVKSLLAFSRQQIIKPTPVNINEIIGEVGELFLRVIGEDIELKAILAPEDLIIMADSVQIEQALLNLVTNARDAMPDGGLLSIETALVELGDEFIETHGYGKHGEYALISITDTGLGIDKEIKSRVFEPFFTTKEVGKGTGLGLSMVYGTIKQHEGYIDIDSEPGKGSTFDIYLPLIKAPAKKLL